jgi:hypothetical protein
VPEVTSSEYKESVFRKYRTTVLFRYSVPLRNRGVACVRNIEKTVKVKKNMIFKVVIVKTSLQMELISTDLRTWSSMLGGLGWNIGYMSLPGKQVFLCPAFMGKKLLLRTKQSINQSNLGGNFWPVSEEKLFSV